VLTLAVTALALFLFMLFGLAILGAPLSVIVAFALGGVCAVVFGTWMWGRPR
jgi:hypothetical protein